MNQRVYDDSLDFARQSDTSDPLRHFRAEFSLPEARNGLSCVYLCGNSLGLMPYAARDLVQQELDDWARLGVRGHFSGRRPWMPYHRNARQGLAYLCGAVESEVVAMNSLTVNLHLMMQTFYRPTAARGKILIESTAFPSDRFAAQSQIRMRGLDPGENLLEWSPREGEAELRMADLETLLERHGNSVALMLLPGVQYYNGQVLDMRRICELGREAGAAVGLDLAHAIGNVPLDLHGWAPDFAAWCSYKYLNSGPGAVAGAFVHERHHGGDGSEQLLGWWGHEEATRLLMAPEFKAEKGADLWQLSNPSVLATAPLLASLEIFERAGIDRLQQKSQDLTGYLAWLLEARFGGRVAGITPPAARAAQLSVVVIDTAAMPKDVLHALEEQNVIVDWREPDVIRVAPAPLYNSYEDVYLFAERLGVILGR